MPTLDIREGAIELMMRVYRNMLPQLGGYLVSGSKINLARCEQFIQVSGCSVCLRDSAIAAVCW